jgi:hypothetical protein
MTGEFARNTDAKSDATHSGSVCEVQDSKGLYMLHKAAVAPGQHLSVT